MISEELAQIKNKRELLWDEAIRQTKEIVASTGKYDHATGVRIAALAKRVCDTKTGRPKNGKPNYSIARFCREVGVSRTLVVFWMQSLELVDTNKGAASFDNIIDRVANSKRQRLVDQFREVSMQLSSKAAKLSEEEKAVVAKTVDSLLLKL